MRARRFSAGKYTGKIVVVKIGGSTLGPQDLPAEGQNTTLEDLVTLHQAGVRPVVVHGGGQMITQWLGKQGIPTRFVEGLRVTDAESLQVVVAVLAGWVNTEIVVALQRLGGQALGLSGTDGRLIQARPKDPLLGYVGEVVAINPGVVHLALEGGYIPVIAPIGLEQGGQPLNINADTAAGELATALGAEALLFLTDVPGVCDQEGNLLTILDSATAETLMGQGVITGGMIPKVEACLGARARVQQALIIDGRRPRALLEALGGTPKGTRIA